MRSAVLFLDHDWMPLRIEPWQRAISDFFLGKIEVIEYSRDRTIQGVGRTHPMPSVVRVLRRFRRDRRWLSSIRLRQPGAAVSAKFRGRPIRRAA